MCGRRRARGLRWRRSWWSCEAIARPQRGPRRLSRSTHKTLSEIAATQQVPPLAVVTKGLFNPANVVETAWTSARDTNALDQWPYEILALAVSRVYERQAAYGTLSRQIAADIYMDLRRRGFGPVLQEGFAGFIVLAHDFANRTSPFNDPATFTATEERVRRRHS